MTAEERIVIAGAGLAGLRAAERLRELGFAGELVMVGDERRRPYHRPALTKQLLSGELRPHHLNLKPYVELDAIWRTCAPALRLDTSRHVVELAGDEELRYDGLVIATGVQPRHLPGTPRHSNRIHMLRTLSDAIAVQKNLRRGSGPVAVIGGGFTACEIASTCREMGREVTIISRNKVLCSRVFGNELGERIGDLQRKHGVRLAMGAEVTHWMAQPQGLGMYLSTGEMIVAECVILAVGSVPAVQWLRGSGLTLEDGVLCRPTCHVVGANDVVAAGDVARWPNLRFEAVPRRLEHWINAVEMGRHAAESLMAGSGAAKPFMPMPRFWTEMHGVRLQAAGMPTLGEEMVKLAGRPGRRGVLGQVRDGRLIGIIGWDSPRGMLRWTAELERELNRPHTAPQPKIPAELVEGDTRPSPIRPPERQPASNRSGYRSPVPEPAAARGGRRESMAGNRSGFREPVPAPTANRSGFREPIPTPTANHSGYREPIPTPTAKRSGYREPVAESTNRSGFREPIPTPTANHSGYREPVPAPVAKRSGYREPVGGRSGYAEPVPVPEPGNRSGYREPVPAPGGRSGNREINRSGYRAPVPPPAAHSGHPEPVASNRSGYREPVPPPAAHSGHPRPVADNRSGYRAPVPEPGMQSGFREPIGRGEYREVGYREPVGDHSGYRQPVPEPDRMPYIPADEDDASTISTPRGRITSTGYHSGLIPKISDGPGAADGGSGYRAGSSSRGSHAGGRPPGFDSGYHTGPPPRRSDEGIPSLPQRVRGASGHTGPPVPNSLEFEPPAAPGRYNPSYSPSRGLDNGHPSGPIPRVTDGPLESFTETGHPSGSIPRLGYRDEISTGRGRITSSGYHTGPQPAITDRVRLDAASGGNDPLTGPLPNGVPDWGLDSGHPSGPIPRITDGEPDEISTPRGRITSSGYHSGLIPRVTEAARRDVTLPRFTFQRN